MHFQLRHNHVVPALTGRCICVCEERVMYKYSFRGWVICIVILHLPILLYMSRYLPYTGETREGEKQSRGIICVCAHMPAELPLFPLLSVSFFPVLSPFLSLSFYFCIRLCIYVCICICRLISYSESSLARYSKKKPVKAK